MKVLVTDRWRPVDKRKGEHPVQYIVDISGAGTHKEIQAAMDDAAKHPKRCTMIRIQPRITIENFGGDDEPTGDI